VRVSRGQPPGTLSPTWPSLCPKTASAAVVTKPFEKQPAKGDLVLKGVTLHLLDNVHQTISATAIREAVAREITGQIPGSCGRGLHQEDGLYKNAK